MTSDDPLATLRLVARRMVLGRQPSEDLPDIATDLLVRGLDSPALRELAGTRRVDYQDARDIFYRVCDELDTPIPEPNAARLEFVYFWAASLHSGDVEPIEASSRIGEEWDALGRPGALTVFAGLASQWEDDPEHRAEFERDMRFEASELLRHRP